MKSLIILLTILFSTTVFSADLNWLDIQSDSRLESVNGFVVEGDQANFKIPEGSYFDVVEVVPLPYINVTLYKTRLVVCLEPHITSEMQLISFNEVVIGVQMYKFCELEFFVEDTDLLKRSLFRE